MSGNHHHHHRTFVLGSSRSSSSSSANSRKIRCHNMTDQTKMFALMASCIMIAFNLYSISVLQKYQYQYQQLDHHPEHRHGSFLNDQHHSPAKVQSASKQQQQQQQQQQHLSRPLSSAAAIKKKLEERRDATAPTTLNNTEEKAESDQDKKKQAQKTSLILSPPASSVNTQLKLQELLDIWNKIPAGTTKVVPLNNNHNNSNKHETTTNNHHQDYGNFITITAHLGITKLERFLIMVRRWNGPVSAAIYITSMDDLKMLLEFYENNLMADLKKHPTNNIYMLLDKDGGMYQNQYPYNVLRQIALDNCESDYFLTMDVDFVTTPNAFETLQAKLPQWEQEIFLERPKTVVVLPAFERTEQEIKRTAATKAGDVKVDWIAQHADEVLPNDKSELVKMIHDKKMMQFHGAFSVGHGPTEYNRWYAASESAAGDNRAGYYYIDYQVKYEPYVIGYKGQGRGGQQQSHVAKKNGLVPSYWEGFRTYHYNKYSWFMELYFDGYEFAVSTTDFVIHLEHPYPPKQDMIKTELNKFRNHLRQKYKWTQQTLQTVISKRMNYEEPKYAGPVGIAKLVGWKEQNGFVFGRIMNVEGTEDGFIASKEFLGTAKIIEGTIAVDQTVTSRSGHHYYLSGEALVRR